MLKYYKRLIYLKKIWVYIEFEILKLVFKN